MEAKNRYIGTKLSVMQGTAFCSASSAPENLSKCAPVTWKFESEELLEGFWPTNDGETWSFFSKQKCVIQLSGQCRRFSSKDTECDSCMLWFPSG